MTKEFEIARLMVLGEAFNGRVDPSRAFAWSKRIYPLTPDVLDEAFESDFHVGETKTRAVLGELDTFWNDGLRLSFYQLESILESHVSRLQMMDIFRLAALDHRFDESVWAALQKTGDCPIEAIGIADPFDATRDLQF